MAVFDVMEIVKATGGRLLAGVSDLCCNGISTDTRTLRPGEAFLALKGERFDGHEHFQEAVDQGAGLLIGMQDEGYPDGLTVIRVEDTLLALGDLARFHRQRFDIPVIGITGSNGKTSTKEMTAAVLGHVWPIVKTEKNFNNEIGLPLTLLRLETGDKACVVEMGMRGSGQIEALCRIAQPTMGIVTNVGVTHMELLGSQEAIAEAKAELPRAISGDGTLILNDDDPRVAAMSRLSKGKAYRYSLQHSADLFLIGHRPEGIGQHLEVDGAWGRFSFRLPALGRHNASNALAAALAGLILGISPSDVGAGLGELVLADQRLLLRESTEGLRILDDTYNSSPPAVEAALDAMDGLEAIGARYAVLGDMLELGSDSQLSHAKIGERVAAHRIDLLYTFGPLSELTAESARKHGVTAHHFTDMEELLTNLTNQVEPGDLVLVKGSRGMRMERVVHALIGRDKS